MHMHKALALLAVLPTLIASAPAPVVGTSTRFHVPRTKQDFRGCLLFAGFCPAQHKRRDLLKDPVLKKRSAIPRSKNSICHLNTNILNKIPFPFIFGKDREEQKNSLETSKSSDDENLEAQVVESDCDWEYRDCDTRVINCILVQQHAYVCNPESAPLCPVTLFSAMAVRDHGVPGHP
jgi:hypothetical protein